MNKIFKVGVIGSGSFGTAMGTVAARAGNNVLMYTKSEQVLNDVNNLNKNLKYFPNDITLPSNLRASLDIKEVLDADFIIHAVPVQVSYELIKEIKDDIKEGTPYIIASKGILLKQKKFFSDVWTEIFGDKKVEHMVISGPSFAIEVMKSFPTVVLLAGNNNEKTKMVQDAMTSRHFKVYRSTDVKGAEIGGALKNALAIASGIAEGLGYSFNTQAAIITRGIYELSLFSKHFGGMQETLFGLSGIGDVMLSGLGNLSRNKSVGIRLAKGENLESIIKTSLEVAEGVPTVLVLGEIIKENELDMPIMHNLYKFIKEEINLEELSNIIFKLDLGQEEFEKKSLKID